MTGTSAILGCGISRASRSHLINSLDEMVVYTTVADVFHHSQMFEIIVRLEEGVAGEEFDEYTADTPYVTREGPAQTKDDFRGSVMSRGNDG